ncbi:MAG: glutamyl-tRNA reductase [Halobacteriales archaeon]|jgi:glutamyl-tRNA reductase
MAFRSGVISGVAVSHETATVEAIAAISEDSQATAVTGLLADESVEEAFVLQTCNRAEAYVVTDDQATGLAALETYAADAPEAAVRTMDHDESVRHLLRVASGLESLVLGEDQILGQVRTAYEEARGAGGIGPMLEETVTKAIHVGERVRNETGINEGIVSLGSAAVQVASEDRALSDATALVIGAGEMGTIAARAFGEAGVERVIVANRTIPHAEHLADEVAVPATAVGLDDVDSALREATVVVTATDSDDPILDAGVFDGAGATTVIDIGQPRDVDPSAADRESVSLHDLDDLESITERTRERRRDAVAAVEAIVDAEEAHLRERFKRKRADQAIATMYESADRIKARELETALSKLEDRGDLTDKQREAVESLADAVVGQLLAAPTKALRDAAAEDDWATINAALQLFDPDFGGERLASDSDSSDPEVPAEFREN